MHRCVQALAAVCLAGFAFVLPQPAQAADQCNATVIDATSGHVLDLSKIDAATKPLENLGADVRIRAFQTAPNGSLEDYYNKEVKACPSWQGPDGRPKANLVVYLFSMDHLSNFYYGSNWHGGLDSNWNRIRTDYMNAQFKLGKFTDGITKAEDETYRVLNNQMHPSSNQGSGSSGSSGIGKAFGYGFLGLLGLAVLVGAIAGLVFLRKRNQRLKAANLKAQQKAVAARDKASTDVGALDMSNVRLSYETVITDLNPDDKKTLRGLLQTAEESYGAAINAESDISDKAETYDPTRKRTTEDYDSITARCNEVATLASQAKTAIKSLDDACATLLADIQNAPQQRDGLEAEYAQLMALQAKLTADGYRHDVLKVLDTVRRLLDEATRQIDAKHHGQALDELTESDHLCWQVKDKLEWLGKVRQDLTDHSAKSKQTLQRVTADANAGSTALELLRSSYHESGWEDLATAENDVNQRIVNAEASIHLADSAMAMNSQRWEEAAQKLDAADSQLVQAAKFRPMVDERREDLERLKQELPTDLANLEASIRDAEVTVNSLRGHHARRLTSLKQAAAGANQLRQQLQADKPAYLEIASAIDSLQKTVSKLLEKAQAENDSIIAEERRKREEDEAAERRRRDSSFNNLGTGIAIGSSLNNGGYSSGGGGGFDFGGGGGGSWGGDSGGGGGGSW